MHPVARLALPPCSAGRRTGGASLRGGRPLWSWRWLCRILLLWGALHPWLLAGQVGRLPPQAFEECLRRRGFPDAACARSGDTLTIVYHRSRYREGAPATSRLLDRTDSLDLIGVRILRVDVLDRNLPMYTHHFPVREGRPDISSSEWTITRARPDRELVRRAGRYENYTLLLTLDPQFRFAFGANPDPVQVQANLLPSALLRLWPGSLLRIQYVLPLWNELDLPEEDRPRPGLLTFSQQVRLFPGAFAELTAGYFRPWRYGARLQAGVFLWQDRLFAGGAMGHTGYASNPQRLGLGEARPGWQYSPLGYTDYRLTAGWRFHRLQLQALASWGRGLGGQEITTLHLARQFRQVSIAFFVQQLDADRNYGIFLRLPIPFLRHFIGRRLTLQTAPFLDFHYNGTQHYANDYDTGLPFPWLRDNQHPGMIFDP